MKTHLLAILTIALLVLTGCGGAQQDVTTQQPTQETANEEAKTAPALTGAASELKGLMAAKGTLKYQITYDVLTKTEGQEMRSTMIQYFDGANRFRTDITVKGVSEMRTYVINGAATSCAKVNNKWMCNSAEASVDESRETEEAIVEGTSNYVITADGTKQLLGKIHNCYKLVDAPNAVTLRYCYSSDGVPVYISTEMSEATTEMTALLYGKDVAETVWTIPI